jgi:zinc transport system permease protein
MARSASLPLRTITVMILRKHTRTLTTMTKETAASMADFLLYALLAGLALAIVAGPLGSFVVWRRMAYFGDTLSHAALLGVALGFLLDISPTIAVTVGCLLLAILLVTLQQRQPLASDTLLGILAPSTLSLGLVVLSFMREVRIDLMGYLFGDLLAISPTDLSWILGGSAAVLVLVCALWRPLLAITVHEELATVEGLPVAALRMTLMLLIAVVIAVAMKIVGVLLITSLLIIPAAAAQRHARSPEQMALGASVIGVLAVCGGLALSWFKDTPAGPSIVVCAAALFLLSFLLPKR